MKRYFLSCIVVVALLIPAFPQNAPPSDETVKPGDNLVVEKIPPIPLSIDEQTRRYGDYRTAALFDWNPLKHEMLIGTRFADVQQVHWVSMPGGERKQMTFYPDRVNRADFEPHGKYFVFSKDIGGGEWYQFYRFDVATGDITLLSDGKSRNTSLVFAHDDSRIAYSSTRRDREDNDLWTMDTADPKTDHMLLELKGGGWQATD